MLRLCKDAVTNHKVKWSKKDRVDRRILSEWERKLHECIDQRIQLFEAKHINKRKKHVLHT